MVPNFFFHHGYSQDLHEPTRLLLKRVFARPLSKLAVPQEIITEDALTRLFAYVACLQNQ